MIQTGAFSALVAASMVLASTRPVRGQDAAIATATNAAEEPVVEPLPATGLPATSAPAQTPFSPAQPRMIHEHRDGLVVSGAVVFGISYGLALFGGLMAQGSTDYSCNCASQGAAVMVPVAGPLLALAVGPHNATDTKVALVWSGVEAAGLAALIVGLIGHDVPQKPKQTAPGIDVSFIPAATSKGGLLALRRPW